MNFPTWICYIIVFSISVQFCVALLNPPPPVLLDRKKLPSPKEILQLLQGSIFLLVFGAWVYLEGWSEKLPQALNQILFAGLVMILGIFGLWIWIQQNKDF